mmetsp:Transcript_23116/g.45489  ORF Transcript_23116/g.45489 Transcript_23116/m.45489 type:complete len:409 (+) Transcript_23116:298-1524(+)
MDRERDPQRHSRFDQGSPSVGHESHQGGSFSLAEKPGFGGGAFRCKRRGTFGEILDKTFLPSVYRLSVDFSRTIGLQSDVGWNAGDQTVSRSFDKLVNALADSDKRPPIKQLNLPWVSCFGTVRNARALASTAFPPFERLDAYVEGEAAVAFLETLAERAEEGMADGEEKRGGGGRGKFETLDLHLNLWNRIEDWTLVASLLPRARLCTLRQLHLWRVRMGEEGSLGSTLGQMVRQGDLCLLESLRMDMCWSSREDMRLMMESVYESEKGLPKLESIQFFCTAACGMFFLASALGMGKLPRLKRLHVSVGQMDDQDVLAFADLVQTNDLPSLTHLIFASNPHITEAGLRGFVDALTPSSFPNVQQIDFSRSGVTGSLPAIRDRIPLERLKKLITWELKGREDVESAEN